LLAPPRWGLRLNAEKQCMEIDPKELGPGTHWLMAAEGGGEGAERLEALLRAYGPLWQVCASVHCAMPYGIN